MRHRSASTFRRAGVGDLRVLALGIVLVVTGIGLFTCSSPRHRLGSEPVLHGDWSISIPSPSPGGHP
jgi:hypothetical protein